MWPHAGRLNQALAERPDWVNVHYDKVGRRLGAPVGTAARPRFLNQSAVPAARTSLTARNDDSSNDSSRAIRREIRCRRIVGRIVNYERGSSTGAAVRFRTRRGRLRAAGGLLAVSFGSAQLGTTADENFSLTLLPSAVNGDDDNECDEHEQEHVLDEVGATLVLDTELRGPATP